MTFSIVARSADGESWGVAVASKFLAVGSVVPAARAGTGAVATQAWVNLDYKQAALARLREGASAAETLQHLLAAPDDRQEHRQVGIVDVEGGAATYTGTSCEAWAGGLSGDGYAIQGNILAGEEVVAAMEAAFVASDTAAPLARRLLAALRAGDEAGGDARGRQSASILVVRDGAGFDGGDDIDVDLRVDDHTRPIDELERVLDIHQLLRTVVPEDERVPDTPELLAEMESRARSLGHRSFLFWIAAHDLYAFGGEDWTGTRLIDELREATPHWRAEP